MLSATEQSSGCTGKPVALDSQVVLVSQPLTLWCTTPCSRRSPAMHAPLDSELVPVFSNHVSYMSGILTPLDLLVSNVNLTEEFAFVIHGTPIGVLRFFRGSFVKRGPPVP